MVHSHVITKTIHFTGTLINCWKTHFALKQKENVIGKPNECILKATTTATKNKPF